jgi:hypothetical protein
MSMLTFNTWGVTDINTYVLNRASNAVPIDRRRPSSCPDLSDNNWNHKSAYNGLISVLY